MRELQIKVGDKCVLTTGFVATCIALNDKESSPKSYGSNEPRYIQIVNGFLYGESDIILTESECPDGHIIEMFEKYALEAIGMPCVMAKVNLRRKIIVSSKSGYAHRTIVGYVPRGYDHEQLKKECLSGPFGGRNFWYNPVTGQFGYIEHTD